MRRVLLDGTRILQFTLPGPGSDQDRSDEGSALMAVSLKKLTNRVPKTDQKTVAGALRSGRGGAHNGRKSKECSFFFGIGGWEGGV